MMHITIPADTTAEDFQSALGGWYVPFLDWIRANSIAPESISPGFPIEITDQSLALAWMTGELNGGVPVRSHGTVPVTVPMPHEIQALLAERFGGVWENEPAPDRPSDDEAVSLDEMSHLIEQLARARADEKAARERAEEAKTQILARIRESGKEFGTVRGQRVVQAKTIEKSQFQTVKFRAEHPDLAGQFTTTRTETRLELL
ncbi:MAG TPA: hypothetical protein VHU81_06450 [Thermoanaerobaculia bacterium]|jgi:hypothetical protein|nr:hypothetical protein [Thermoanaerobaculia bacterium]